LIEGRSAGLSRALPLPGLDRIVRRCMRAAPSERYVSTEALLADLRSLESGSGTVPRPAGDALWWWQFHQLGIAAVNGLMPAAIWAIRAWLGRPYGSTLFLAALMLATISVTLRLNLFFTSRVHPGMLVEQRNRLHAAIMIDDGLLALLLLVAAGLLAGDHDEMAALCLSVATVVLASLTLIEPATTRAAGLKA
jgi:hypothetical protein